MFYFIHFSTPEEVGLCLLPEVAETEDVTVQIHHKLVEAFCWENDIEVIKVSIYYVYKVSFYFRFS